MALNLHFGGNSDGLVSAPPSPHTLVSTQHKRIWNSGFNRLKVDRLILWRFRTFADKTTKNGVTHSIPLVSADPQWPSRKAPFVFIEGKCLWTRGSFGPPTRPRISYIRAQHAMLTLNCHCKKHQTMLPYVQEGSGPSFWRFPCSFQLQVSVDRENMLVVRSCIRGSFTYFLFIFYTFPTVTRGWPFEFSGHKYFLFSQKLFQGKSSDGGSELFVNKICSQIAKTWVCLKQYSVFKASLRSILG